MSAKPRFSRAAALAGASLLGLALAGPAAAQMSGEADGETDVIRVTATPLGTPADEVVGSVDVVTRAELVRNLDGNVADTIDRLPGVSSTYFGPASGRPVVRGLGADRVRVLVNGLGALDASASSPDHAVSAGVLGAQRVEVLRGPAAIGYGGGAIGGVVNIVDGRIPEAAPENGFGGEVYLGASDVDDGYQTALRLTGAAGGFVFQGEYQRREADMFEIPGFAETLAEREEHEHGEHKDEHHDAGHHDHDADHGHEHGHEEEPAFGMVPDSDYEFETISGGVSFVGDWGFVGVSVKDEDAEYGLPGHAHAHGEEGHDHGADHEEHDHGHEDGHGDEHDHGHDHAHGEEGARLVLEQTRYDLRGEVRRDGFFNRVKFSAAYADYAHAELEGDEIGTRFTKEGLEARVEVRHQHDGPRQGAFGVNLLDQDFAADGAEAFIEPVTTTDFGLFLVERWDFDSWGVEAGGRIETRELDGVRGSRSFDTVSGSLSGFIRPGGGWFAGATLSYTERAPTDVEVFALGPHLATNTYEIGDLDLGEETAWSLEATARRDVGAAQLEATGFAAAYDGFIGLFPTGEERDGLDVFEYRQADATLYGLEASASAPLAVVSGISLEGEAALDYVRAELDDGGNLPRIPPASALLALTAERGIWSARAETRLVAEQDETAAFERPTDGYALLNADLALTPFEGRDLTLILAVNNITDEEARVHASYLKEQVPLPGRNVRMALSAKF